jgi:monofunctional biosynthetic peptidoglycan transglycosylase
VWRVIDDGVMGGISRGRVELTEPGLCFSGTLSTANNGGFSSLRCELPDPRAGFVGLSLGVIGDGRRYQFRLRDSEDANTPAWRAFFDTDGSAQTIALGLNDFEAVVRGRRVEVLPALADRRIRFAGLMLTSKEEGPFRIELESLELMFEGLVGA